MSAACWYVRAVPRKDFSRYAQRRGAGKVQPVVIVCECGRTVAFDVVAAVGAACETCGAALMTDEQLDAACSALTLGGAPEAVFGEMLGLPEAPMPGADEALDQPDGEDAPRGASDEQVVAVMAAFSAAKKEE